MQESGPNASVHSHPGGKILPSPLSCYNWHYQDLKGTSNGPQSNTWLSKTLSSIKEVAGEKL